MRPSYRRSTSDATSISHGLVVRLYASFSLILHFLLFLVVPALSIHVERVESHSEFSCEPIGLRMCQDLPYNTTFMPNLLNHYDQQTAALAMEPFHPMVNLVCSADLRMFLCALYAPVCTQYGRASLPCRALCQRTQQDCHQLMEMFGIQWPDGMECSRFPDCDEAYPREEDLLAISDPTEQSSLTVQRDYGFWCPRELKVDPELGYTFLGRRDCSAPCPSMFFRRPQLTMARNFIGVVSIVCLSATLFTFLTFLIDVTRFRYPERPIIFYCVCYVMVSLVFFLGFLLEDRIACNAASPAHFRASTITQGSHNKVCTLFFMVLYFFTMAGNVWWVILTITWFLAAVPKWGSEAIEKKALLFHACAWGLPGALTVTLLALNKIEGDGISGVCFIGLYDVDALRWFILAPLCLNVVWRMEDILTGVAKMGHIARLSWYQDTSEQLIESLCRSLAMSVGVSLLLVGIVALNRVRMEIPLEKENQTKLVKFMIRIGVFSMLYLVPLLSVIGCYLYEHSYRGDWETTWIDDNCRGYHIPCPYKVEQSHRPSLILFLIKYLMMLVVGIPSVFWVGSKKTCFGWASFLHGHKRKEVIHVCQVLQEQPDLAQSLLRDPNTPIIRKSRGTSTQGTSTHASSTHLAVLDEPSEPIRPLHGPPASTRSKASSVHSKASYHGSLNHPQDKRHETTVSYRGAEVRSLHGSMPRLDHPLSNHSSLHQLGGQSAHGSQRDASEAQPALITHGSAEADGRAAGDDAASA